MITYIIKLNEIEMGRFNVSTADLPTNTDLILIRATFAKLWVVSIESVRISVIS